MIVPERVTRKGNVVPAFQIDDKYGWAVERWKWISKSQYHKKYLMATTQHGKKEFLHRLLWKLEYGSESLPKWPLRIDHINEDPLDNRIENLRVAGPILNGLNSSKDKNRGSGLPRGVCYDKNCKSRPYFAHIRVNGRLKHLGMFATPEEAHEAYLKAKAELMIEEHNKHNQL